MVYLGCVVYVVYLKGRGIFREYGSDLVEGHGEGCSCRCLVDSMYVCMYMCVCMCMCMCM